MERWFHLWQSQYQSSEGDHRHMRDAAPAELYQLRVEGSAIDELDPLFALARSAAEIQRPIGMQAFFFVEAKTWHCGLERCCCLANLVRGHSKTEGRLSNVGLPHLFTTARGHCCQSPRVSPCGRRIILDECHADHQLHPPLGWSQSSIPDSLQIQSEAL